MKELLMTYQVVDALTGDSKGYYTTLDAAARAADRENEWLVTPRFGVRRMPERPAASPAARQAL